MPTDISGKGRRLLRKTYIRKMLNTDSDPEIIRYGSEYGGYAVDKSILDKNKDNTIIVYSFGIGEDLSFSEGIMRDRKCEVYAFDPTPRAAEYAKKHRLSEDPRFHFFQYGISVRNDREVFYLPDNQSYVSGALEYHSGLSKNKSIEVELKTLDSLMIMLGHSKIDILKMDIEGEEFSVIDHITDKDIKPDQICLEIHDRLFRDGKQRLKKMLDTLKQNGYKLIYISDSYEELTFIRQAYLAAASADQKQG